MVWLNITVINDTPWPITEEPWYKHLHFGTRDGRLSCEPDCRAECKLRAEKGYFGVECGIEVGIPLACKGERVTVWACFPAVGADKFDLQNWIRDASGPWVDAELILLNERADTYARQLHVHFRQHTGMHETLLVTTN